MDTTPPDRLSPRAREIVGVALELLEEEGPDGLSMRKLAERLGIRAPSIYKHLPDKKALEAAIISVGFEEQAAAFEAAVAGSADPLAAIAGAYREFALRRPHLYRLMTEHELDRDRLTPGVEERAARPLVAAVAASWRGRSSRSAPWVLWGRGTLSLLQPRRERRRPWAPAPVRPLAPGPPPPCPHQHQRPAPRLLPLRGPAAPLPPRPRPLRRAGDRDHGLRPRGDRHPRPHGRARLRLPVGNRQAAAGALPHRLRGRLTPLARRGGRGRCACRASSLAKPRPPR